MGVSGFIGVISVLFWDSPPPPTQPSSSARQGRWYQLINTSGVLLPRPEVLMAFQDQLCNLLFGWKYVRNIHQEALCNNAKFTLSLFVDYLSRDQTNGPFKVGVVNVLSINHISTREIMYESITENLMKNKSENKLYHWNVIITLWRWQK